MKTNQFIAYLTVATMLLTTACSDDPSSNSAPDLPPIESLAINFSAFTDNYSTSPEQIEGLSASESYGSFATAYLTVAIWNTLLYQTLIVPVIAYEYAFTQTPVKIDDNTWQWSYTLGGNYTDYSAILTAEVLDSSVEWEMKITCNGTNAYAEFLWFEGSSQTDGSAGSWTLNHSYEFQEPVITLDWEASGGEINNTVYQFVRELDDNRDTNPFYGSTLEYGINEESNIYYYYIYYYNEYVEDFVDVDIEMDMDDSSGRIKSTNWDSEWHCWDNTFQDIDCDE